MVQRTLFNRPAGPKLATTRKKRPPLNSKVLTLMNQRERQILVHSNLYYRQNTNIVSDFQYDRWSHELYDLITKYPKEFRKSAWFQAFRDFDGNTGMGLPYTHPWVEGTALHLLKITGGKS